MRSLLMFLKFIYFYFSGNKFIIFKSNRVGHLILNTLDALDSFKKFKINSGSKDLPVFLFLGSVCSDEICDVLTSLFHENSLKVLNLRKFSILAGLVLKVHRRDRALVDRYFREVAYSRIDIAAEWHRFQPRVIDVPHNYASTGYLFGKNYRVARGLLVDRPPEFSARYVCFYSRDSEYLKEVAQTKSQISFHEYRNSDFRLLFKSIKYISRVKGRETIRVGSILDPAANVEVARRYGTKVLRGGGSDSEASDYATISNAEAMIIDTSGLAYMGIVTGVPMLRFNWIPIFNSLPYRSVMLPMLIRRKVSDELVGYRELFSLHESYGAMFGSSFFEYNDLYLQKNSADEILSGVEELYARIEVNDFCVPENQTAFKKFMESQGFNNHGLVGSEFFEKYHCVFD